MHFHIYCNQKSISATHMTAITEFQKRLSAYCEISFSKTIHPVAPCHINPSNCHILIENTGKSTFSSEEFAKKIGNLQLNGRFHICVYIGYPENLLHECLTDFLSNSVHETFSLTGCSFHAETRTLLFYEQLYRGYTILQGKTYHK